MLPALTVKSGTGTGRTSRTQLVQDIIDDESSEISFAGLNSTSPVERQPHLPEPIDINSSFVSQSPYGKPGHVQYGSGNDRSPKRRRISIASSESDPELVADSQAVTVSPFKSRPASPHIEDHILPDTPSDDDDDTKSDHENDALSIQLASSPIPSAPRSPSLSIKQSPSSPSASDSPPSPSAEHHQRHQNQQQQPIFHKAPRFKISSDQNPHHQQPQLDESRLPDIFSPQRRGARYLPGGLASELRDWLVEIKENDLEPSAHQYAAVRLAIEQVRHGGPGMTLISGRPIGEGGQLGPSARAILTGDGVLEEDVGLGGVGARSKVVPGGVVAVAPPAWDVEIPERWAIAYRWGLVREGGVGDNS